ncbi:N-acetyl-S-(2-succino)cysteine monooxygenase [Hyphomicrobiales bacterium]|nr:N-acetyl-S-(2-succino)cysteine monooxygenase [Hyphomicrobiales bacterium]
MHFGLSMRYHGYALGAWRHPDIPAGGTLDFNYFLQTAKIAERAKFDMIFFADGLAVRGGDDPPGALSHSSRNVELEPLTLLAALAPMTNNIGLVATASTTYNEPYHIARKFSSIDHISGGRAGWNIVTSWSDDEARNFGREKHLDYDTRYDRAKEFASVVTGLWDSWDDDAFVHDKQSGLFYDPDKLRVLNHKGPHFSVRGPLTSGRTAQGRPILVQAGDSEQGREIGALYADAVYTSHNDLDAAHVYYKDMQDRLAAAGRQPGSLKVLPAITPFIGESIQEAQDKYGLMQELIDPLTGLSMLFTKLGDLSGYDLDGPVPLPLDPAVRSIGRRTYELAQKENLTIRQLYQRMAAGTNSRAPMIGTGKQIADVLEEWFTTGAADGFNLCSSCLPQGMDDFARLVVPELQRRGLFRTEYTGATLRDNLSLPRMPSRYIRGAGTPGREVSSVA